MAVTIFSVNSGFAKIAKVHMLSALIAALLVSTAQAALEPNSADQHTAEAPAAIRLYVLDCGTLHIGDISRYGLTKDEVASTDLAVPCFLISHPGGTLIWDAGAVPDDYWKPTGAPVDVHVVLPRPEEFRFGNLTMVTTLASQLAQVGYAPGDITYLALSHYHYDHTANANLFAGSTWLVRQVEREAMFAERPPAVTQPSSYSRLQSSRTILIEQDAYDVFGDGTVVIRSAPGHTPGHQVLYVKLPKAGGIVLSGDLYHYAEARTLQRFPAFNFDQKQSAQTREAVESFLRESGAQLWIQHDLPSNSKLKKTPFYYE